MSSAGSAPAALTDPLGQLTAAVLQLDRTTLSARHLAGSALAPLGYAPESWIADPEALAHRLPPEDRSATLALLRAVAADGQHRQLEHRLIAADGGERWFFSEAGLAAPQTLVLLLVDITEARSAVDALQTTAEHLWRVVDSAPLVLFAIDASGIITLSEGRGLRALGLRPGETVGKSVFTLYGQLPSILGALQRALAGETFSTIAEVPPAGAWLETFYAPLYDEAGRRAGSIGVCLDITERMTAQAASVRSLSLLRATLEATADAILVTDPEGRVVDFNRHFAELWRLPESMPDCRGQQLRTLTVLLDQLRDPEPFIEALGGAVPERRSRELVELRDGRLFERDAAPQRVDDQTVGQVWSFRDVTVSRRAARHAKLLVAASKLLGGSLEEQPSFETVVQLAVPHLGDWSNLILVDQAGQAANVAACHIDPARVALVQKLRPDLRYTDRGVEWVLKSGEPVMYNGLGSLERAQSEAPGNPFGHRSPEQLATLRQLGPRALLCVPLRSRGQTLGALVFATADPRRHYDEEDLRTGLDLAQRAAFALDNQRLYRSLQQAIKLRDEFLSVASHELRTPITSLLLAVQGALATGEAAAPAFLRQALESAERQSRRLGRLIDTLFDLSRVEAERLELHPEPVDLVPLVQHVQLLFAADARRAHSSLELKTGLSTLIGSWDRARLEQVVSNLVANALKYGAGRPVVLTVERSAAGARFAVCDQGIGIAPQEQRRIFERFARAVSARHYGGLGLGLYIVRRIVEALGGTIAVDSAPGAGACFTVELPLGRGDQ